MFTHRPPLSRRSVFDRYLLVLLAAAELLMSFTFLGYLHFPPISITIAYLPILIAGALLGPGEAVLIGALFGLASLFKAPAHYVMPADMVFSPFLSGSPLASLLLAVGCRMAFAAVVGLAFKATRGLRHPLAALSLIAATAPSVHALLVRAGLEYLFPHLGVSVSGFHYGINDFLISLTCVGVTAGAWRLYRSPLIGKLRHGIDLSSSVAPYSRATAYPLRGITVFAFDMMLLAAVYFTDRTAFMLDKHGIDVSSAVFADINLLQLQFLMAAAALSAILSVSLFLTCKYAAYAEFVGGMVALTGVMGRRLFLDRCTETLQATKARDHQGWFLMLDVDHFKTVNDTFGHPEGDRVLAQTAQALQKTFHDVAHIGRLGGDKYAVLIRADLTTTELERRLRAFCDAIAPILPAPARVTSSIGAVRFTCPQTAQNLIKEADKRLYEAKARGRAQWVTGDISASVTSTEKEALHP